MKDKYNFWFLFLFLTLVLPGTAHASSLSYARGKINGPIICTTDSAHSYSLYLPSNYDEDEVWPVIFLFDPSGDGKKALDAFTPAAEEFGYILAASTSTENGPWDSFLEGANAMYEDVAEKLPIDPHRRYTAGFSGAAEAASALAVMYDGIIGVIGCGSGFSPNYAPHFDIDFHYIGLIGDRDFHYQEMRDLEKVLVRHNIEYHIEVYPGGHDWPPPWVVREAILFLEFKAMKYYLARYRDGLVYRFYEEHNNRADSLEAHGNIPRAYAEMNKILAFLDDLKRLDQAEEKRNRYLTSPELKEYMEGQKQLAIKEHAYTDTYIKALDEYKTSYVDGMTPVQPIKWWSKQVKSAQAMIEGRKDPLDTLLGSRLIDFIWRNAYEYYKSVEGTDLYTTAIYYLDIWKVARPGNISAYYFSAKYYTHYGKYKKAIDNLQEAVKNGLDDPDIIENDQVLQQLNEEPGYQSILQHLWANQSIE